MAHILAWQPSQDPRLLLAEVVGALRGGQLVGVPTETVYGIAASVYAPLGAEQIQREKGRPESKPLTLAAGSAEEALEWVPAVGPLGRRLARRCWPGPATLVFRGGFAEGPLDRLPAPIRTRICPGDKLGLRVPDHPAASALLSLAGPLLLTSANRSGEPAAVIAEEVVKTMGDELAWIVDGGACRYARPSTVVLVDSSRWDVLREGVITEAELREMAACRILFVCTGNTCRSPMSLALCKKLLAERLGCRPEDLLERGFVVQSAGLAAVAGDRAAPEAIEAVKERGADLADHETRPLNETLLSGADHVFVMTRSHLVSLEMCFWGCGPRPRLLSSEGADLPDPVGCDQSVYRDSAREIERCLESVVSEVVSGEMNDE